jgi:hypothetical protein
MPSIIIQRIRQGGAYLKLRYEAVLAKLRGKGRILELKKSFPEGVRVPKRLDHHIYIAVELPIFIDQAKLLIA